MVEVVDTLAVSRDRRLKARGGNTHAPVLVGVEFVRLAKSSREIVGGKRKLAGGKRKLAGGKIILARRKKK